MTLSLTTIKKDIYSEKIKEYSEFFSKFFNINSYPKFCVILVNNRKQFDEIMGTKTPVWVVAYASSNQIFMLKPEKWESESDHKYTDDRFFTTLKHEVCHIFFKKYTYRNNPIWLNEGTALYLADQLKHRKEVTKFKNFLKFTQKNSDGKETVYQESGFVVKKLIEKFGKEKFLNLLSELKNLRSLDDFPALFEKIYSIPLTYKTFNNL